MPQFLDFRVNGRVLLPDDDLSRLADVAFALTEVVAKLRALGMLGEYHSKIITSRNAKRVEELPLVEAPLVPVAGRPARPHPDPGGVPLPDSGPGLLEQMGWTPAFQYRYWGRDDG